MATKLRKMHLTSVDLVRAGANQEADICLFKSANGQNDDQQATQSEEALFKQFLDWKQEQAAEATSAANVEKSEAELYVDAISKSVQSICEDDDLSADEKLGALSKSCAEFGAAVEKYNHNHDASTGRFSSGGGGGSSSTSIKARQSLAARIGSRQASGSIDSDKVKAAVERGGRFADYKGEAYLISPQGSGKVNAYIGSKTKSGGLKIKERMDNFTLIEDAHSWALGTIDNRSGSAKKSASAFDEIEEI